MLLACTPRESAATNVSALSGRQCIDCLEGGIQFTLIHATTLRNLAFADRAPEER